MSKPEVTEHWLRKATLLCIAMCIAKASLNRAGPARNFRFARNQSRIDAKGGNHFLQADYPGAIRKTFASWLGFISSR
jgi:hypothetical protein